MANLSIASPIRIPGSHKNQFDVWFFNEFNSINSPVTIARRIFKRRWREGENVQRSRFQKNRWVKRRKMLPAISFQGGRGQWGVGRVRGDGRGESGVGCGVQAVRKATAAITAAVGESSVESTPSGGFSPRPRRWNCAQSPYGHHSSFDLFFCSNLFMVVTESFRIVKNPSDSQGISQGFRCSSGIRRQIPSSSLLIS